jgi:hypothetical protein
MPVCTSSWVNRSIQVSCRIIGWENNDPLLPIAEWTISSFTESRILNQYMSFTFTQHGLIILCFIARSPFLILKIMPTLFLHGPFHPHANMQCYTSFRKFVDLHKTKKDGRCYMCEVAGKASSPSSEMEAKSLRAVPRVPAKGPLKAYRGTIHKTKAPPTAL